MAIEQVPDRWIHGQGLETEIEYMVRTVAPRCIVQIESDDDALLSPLVLVNHVDEAFGVVAWLDPEPDESTHRAILEEAIAANEAFTRNSF